VEPDLLRRGKEFHRRVQADWAGEIESATVCSEHRIALGPLVKTVKHQRHGRIDIFIDLVDDFVSVVEIKSTDWDRIRVHNRQKVLATHRRQVLMYVDKYLDHDQVNVCAGVIYPRFPDTAGLNAQVEQYLNDHALQVVWYDDP
jgi:hypothetical protein